MTRREVVRVRDVAQVIGGATPRTAEPSFWGGAIPWLTPKDLSDRPARYTGQGTRFITDQGLRSSSARLLPAGSILLTSRAPIGLVTIASAPIATNQGFKSLVLDETQCPEYWYYLLSASGDYLHSVANGSTFLEISGKVVGDLEFEVPSLDEQRHIAQVLGALDDLIDTNERLHDRLLEQAFSLFAARTQGVGLVELQELGAMASRGVTPKYATGPDSVVVINQKCIRGFRVDLNAARRMTPRSVRPEKIAEPGDTLVNSTGTGTLGRASRWIGSAAVHVDSHVTVVKSANRSESAYLCYALMCQTEVIESLAEGSTGQTELSRDRLLSLPVPNLLSVERVALSQALDELDVARVGLLAENEQLRRTRDELLPLLMSGAVRVRPEGVAA